MNGGNTGHLARWARFHTGFWHAYPPEDPNGRFLRSVCGFATSTVDALQSTAPDASERWQCRQCRLVIGVLQTREETEEDPDAPVELPSAFLRWLRHEG